MLIPSLQMNIGQHSKFSNRIDSVLKVGEMPFLSVEANQIKCTFLSQTKQES